MTIEKEDLEKIAYLARINIDSNDFPSLKKDLQRILDLVDKMEGTDTDQVSAMAHPLDIQQPLRIDKVTETDDRKNLLSNAPFLKSDLFLVPKVIDEES